MDLQLSHVAEAVVRELINRERRPFLDFAGLLDVSDAIWVDTPTVEFVRSNVPLLPYLNRAFDGAHTIDVAVFPRRDICVALELKLGETGLTRSNFKRWLETCSTSHHDSRWTGSMMAILDRRFPIVAPSGELRVRSVNTEAVVLRRWVLVTRSAASPPKDMLGPDVHVVTIEDIVKCAGGAEVFNECVRSVIRGDHYQAWLGA